MKERIAARDDLREKYDAELLKLLCAGKVMDDDEQIKTFTIKPDGFLVLVKQTPGKPKPVYTFSFTINHFIYFHLIATEKETQSRF